MNGHDRHRAGIDLKHARSALFAIDPGLPREDWHRVGRSAIAAGLSVADLDEWSSSAANYKGMRDVEAAFRGVTPDGGTGPGTLWFEAMKAGWRPPVDDDKGLLPPRAGREPRQETRRPRHRLSAAEVWGRCVPATAEHPYVAAKKGLPDGLRVVPHGDPLRISGLSMAGALAVPMVPLAGGEPVSLQFVAGGEQAVAWKAAGKPSKLNLPGAPMSGCFIVGKIEPGGTAYIVEGVGQGWACWKATCKAAIVTFGFGRMRAVAKGLRERDPAAKLVLVPDAGKEVEAGRIAADVGAELAPMPNGSPPNFDCNDYALAHGFDALASLLALAAEPEKKAAEEEPHLLAQYVEIGAELAPPRMVIPGFIQAGVVVIAGAHGVGKTTVLVPLAMIAAGLHAPGDPLAPRHWRHVVYIAEDEAQVLRILRGVLDHAGTGATLEAARERFHVVAARRLPADEVATVGSVYRSTLTRTVAGVDLPPLVVMDTKSATIEVADENDNAEASRTIALFKQRFADLPLWLVGHVPKALMTRKGVQALSARGASAIEADAHQCAYLVAEDGGTRFLVLGKRRFEPRWTELEVVPDTAEVTARDEFGDTAPLTLRWGWPTPPDHTRAQAAEQARAAKAAAAANAMRAAVLDAVETAELAGQPLSRRGVEKTVNGRATEVRGTIAKLEDESWLVAVEVPSQQRTNPRRAEFLIRLNDVQRRDRLAGKPLPLARLAVPPSWRNSDASGRDTTTPRGGSK